MNSQVVAQAGEWRPRHSPWLVAASVVLPTFMEVLDTTIVTVALPHIAGSMAATNSEATWTLTSYLVANGVVVPISAWLALRFGRKRLIMLCTASFVASSMLCGLAPALTFLVLARVFQGFGGGAMVPLAQAVLLESFPPEKRGLSMAMFGLVIVLAPVIGPIFGGWLTDNYSWRWAFYINLPVGLLALLLMARYLEDPPWIAEGRAGRLDKWGLAFLIVWVGALQVVLDKGQDEDWFASPLITRLTLVTVAGLIAFLVQELRAREPVVDLRVFRDNNFAVSAVTIALVSGAMYASVTLLPQFMQTLLNYTAEHSGWAIAPRGLGAFVGLPLAGLLLTRVDGRKLIAFGLCMFALSNYLLGNLTLETTIGSVGRANVLQGFSMGFIFVPLSTLAVARLRNEQMGNATSIFNLVRNVGGSIGISLWTTYLVRGAQRVQANLVHRLTPYDPAYQQFLAGLQAALSRIAGTAQAQHQAYGAIYGILLQQATLVSFANTYRWLVIAVLLCLPAAFLLKKVATRTAGIGLH
ncbi:MAG: DHA2 family efflux MFS transporter permease subunit [Bryobacteraceae bacterium]